MAKKTQQNEPRGGPGRRRKRGEKTGHNLKAPRLRAGYFEEPPLAFGDGNRHVDIKKGLTLYGPRSLSVPSLHPDAVRVGFVGSGASTGSARRWFESCLGGVEGDEDNERFPGFSREEGFRSQLLFDDRWEETLTQRELLGVAAPRLRKDRFDEALRLVSDKLRRLSGKDRPPDYVVLALPDEMLEHCKTVDYKDDELGTIHRDFRRALKAEAMRYRLPTQILLQRVTEAEPGARGVDHKSRCAWNLFTGLYFKGGGVPWVPTSLKAGTCYVGVSFYRALGSHQAHATRTAVAQAFDEHGNGLVLRGPEFFWDEHEEGTPTAHLSAEQASELLGLVLKQYGDEMGQPPSRVVVHKSSRFWPEEREGFEEALAHVRQFDLVSVQFSNEMRLLREGQYPPLRGTHFSVGDRHFLYTTGFVPSLATYPHGHVPSPLQIADHVGDTPVEDLLREILVLTRMNWNSAGFAGGKPITLRFSRLVGDIMKEIAPDQEPRPQFKFYM